MKKGVPVFREAAAPALKSFRAMRLKPGSD